MKRQLPKGTNGLYLPDIKLWNSFFKQTKKRLAEGFQLGAIEDLMLENPSGICSECGSELIRLSDLKNGYFTTGIIYCDQGYLKNSHSQKGWFEVWPNINATLTNEERLKINGTQEAIENKYKLSDSRIKKCFYFGLFSGVQLPVFTHP